MFSKLISEPVNLTLYPRKNAEYQADKQIELTIGDLHANALKLIYFLIKHQVLEISKEDYTQLAKIYLKSLHEITKNDIVEFNTILTEAKVNKTGKIRLIGDEVADRGLSCYFVLKVIEKLSIHYVPLVIILSNHGFEFILAYENIENNYSTKFSHVTLDPACAASLIGLQTFIDKEIISYHEVRRLMENHYKPYVKLIDYSLDEEKKTISLYTHAHVGLDTIEAACVQLNESHDNQSIKELARTCTRLNQQTQSYIRCNQLHLLATTEEDGQFELDENKPVFLFLWNREADSVHRPKTENNYYIKYFHGHDSSDLLQNANGSSHIICLDNTLGFSFFLNIKKYVIYLSRDSHSLSTLAIKFSSNLNNLRNSIPDNILALFASPVDDLVVDKILYSEVQINLLHQLLCHPDNYLLWKKLFHNNDARRSDFLKSAKENFDMWNIAYLFQQHYPHYCHNDLFDMLIVNAQYASQIYLVLKELEAANMLKIFLFIYPILNYSYHLNTMIKTLSELNQHDLLNEVTIKTIIHCIRKNTINNYCKRLQILNFSLLLSVKRFNEIFQGEDVPSQLKPYQLIFCLKKNNLFNSEIYKKIVYEISYLDYIDVIFTELSNFSLLNQENINIIFNNLPRVKSLSKNILIMKKLNVLTEHNLPALLELVQESTWVLTELGKASKYGTFVLASNNKTNNMSNLIRNTQYFYAQIRQKQPGHFLAAPASKITTDYPSFNLSPFK